MTVSRRPDTQVITQDRLADAQPTGDLRATLALTAARMGVWSQDLKADTISGDQHVLDQMGVATSADPWSMADFLQVLHPDDRDLVAAKIADVRAGHTPFIDTEMRLVRIGEDPNGPDTTWVSLRGQVITWDDLGDPAHLVAICCDITEAKRNEAKLQTLAAEMDHRVKNAFAVIRAMINIGAASPQSKDMFAETLRTQVDALATAHALSAQMARAVNDPQAFVTLRDVVETALSPWTDVMAGGPTTVDIACDPGIAMRPNQLSALSMMLYELSMNATKYGPLGERGGRLSVNIRKDAAATLQMRWIETIATGTSPPPSRAGMGDVLLRHCATTLNADLARDFTSTGLHVTFTMTLMDSFRP